MVPRVVDYDSSDEEIEIEEREHDRFENVDAEREHFDGVQRLAAGGGGENQEGLRPPRVIYYCSCIYSVIKCEQEVPYVSDSEDENELPDFEADWDFCTSPSCPKLKDHGERHEFFLEGESPDFSYGNIVNGTWKDIELGGAQFRNDSYIAILDEFMDEEFLNKVRYIYHFFRRMRCDVFMHCV